MVGGEGLTVVYDLLELFGGRPFPKSISVLVDKLNAFLLLLFSLIEYCGLVSRHRRPPLCVQSLDRVHRNQPQSLYHCQPQRGFGVIPYPHRWGRYPDLQAVFYWVSYFFLDKESRTLLIGYPVTVNIWAYN